MKTFIHKTSLRDSLALVVKDAQESVWFALNEVEAARVVHEVNALPPNALLTVLLLLVLEHVLIEVELQVLIGVVDAELLKTGEK